MPWINHRKNTPVLLVLLLKIVLAASVITLGARAENFVTNLKPIKLVFEATAANQPPVFAITCTEYFTSTGDCSWFNFNDGTNATDIKRTGNYKRPTVQAFINWHPFGNAFHLTSGAFLGSNRMVVSKKSSKSSSFAVGGSTYATGQIDSLSGDVEFSRTAEPYLGFGWSKESRDGKIGYFADFGILFTTPAKTSLQATGQVADNPGFQSNLRTEEKLLGHTLKPLHNYPIAQIGLVFKF